jgi:hypothetical protein
VQGKRLENCTPIAIRTMVVSSVDGTPLEPADVDILPGPGATPVMRERLSGRVITK